MLNLTFDHKSVRILLVSDCLEAGPESRFAYDRRVGG